MASQIFERAVAHSPKGMQFIPDLIKSYLFRIPIESSHSYHSNLESLAQDLIAKHKKSNPGHALLSALELNKNNTIQAVKHFSNISSKHELSAILDLKINFNDSQQPQKILLDKLDQIKKHPSLIPFYHMMQYELQIRSGNYFAAKPILNERLLQFPKDYWGQNQIGHILKKGQSLKVFEHALNNKLLNPRYASIQSMHAKLLCFYQETQKCLAIYQKLAGNQYQMNNPQLVADAQFQRLFYFLKQQQSNKAAQLIKAMKQSSFYDINQVNLYSALNYDLLNQSLPAKLIIALQEQKLPNAEKTLAQFILAKHYYSKNRFDAFEKTIINLIENNPQFVSAHVFYMVYLVQQNKNKKAVDFANKFIYGQPISSYHIYPQDIPYDSLYLLKSLRLLEQVRRKNPNISKSSIVSSYIGLNYLISHMKHNHKNALNNAEFHLKKAIGRISTHGKTYLFLGILFHYKNNIQASNRYLNKSYALQENDSNILFWFAKNNLATQKNILAEKKLNQLKYNKTWQWPATNLLALILIERKQYAKALSILGTLLQLDPKHFSAWHTLNIIEF
ncbi:hypothetical protein MRY82_04175 [bacterium]|nr:hypothetical protein [bacterium]